MDMKARKLDMIEYLLHLTDEKLMDKIEALIKSGHIAKNPFTQDEMIARAEEANEDYKAGRTLNLDQLDDEMKSW